MAITPQAIKDQEFQVKFRGYDAIEVKAYLELIAEEFFEIFEQVRKQAEEIERVTEEKEDLVGQGETLKRDLDSLQAKNDRLATELGELREKNTIYLNEIESLNARIKDLEEERQEKEDEVTAMRGRLQSESREKEEARHRLAALEQQWGEQKKVEIDFKEAILAAQAFARDVKKKSEEEAEAILEKARADAEKLRNETYQELARYPKEIERLRMKRAQVREDLRTVLTLCLENLDILKEDEKEKDEEAEDFSDLFQSIVVADDGTVNSEELEKLDMNLDLFDSLHTSTDSDPEGTGDAASPEK